MFKVGIFMGWADLAPDSTMPWSILLPVYIGACCWTITYETIYQHQVCPSIFFLLSSKTNKRPQDKQDDIKIGIHSPALFCREYTLHVTTATAIGFFSLVAYGAYLNHHGPPVYVGLVAAAYLLFPHLLTIDIDRPEECRNFFLGTPLVGKVILAGFFLDVLSQRLINGLPL